MAKHNIYKCPYCDYSGKLGQISLHILDNHKKIANKISKVYLDGSLVKCKICRKEFILVSSLHIETHGLSYDEYIEEYGRDSVYSEYYRNLMKKSSKDFLQEEIIERVAKKSKVWWANNREEHSKRLKISQNTPSAKENHKRGLRRYYLYKDTPEKAFQRKKNAINSWKNPEIRSKRMEKINTFYSLYRRAIGARNSVHEQMKYRKITKPQLLMEETIRDFKLNYDVKREYYFDYYYLDIAIPELKIAIECDGNYYHGNPRFCRFFNRRQLRQIKHDRIRDSYLKDRGWKVLRF